MKPTFYLAFANSISNILPNLSEEAMKISDLLQGLAFNDKLYYIKDEIFDVERLVLNFSKYGERFDIFYFSGHGKDGCLQFTNDLKMDPHIMSEAIKNSLRNIKLIFLNACETFGLAQKIIQNRKPDDDKVVLISCRNEINVFIAERFATLLFTQIGQPGSYRDAYNQAKSLVQVMNKGIRFREFDNPEDVLNADKDFDFGYIEIESRQEIAARASAAVDDGNRVAPAAAPPQKSIIGQDKLTIDALTTNYLHEVVESISSSPKIGKEQVTLLSDALQAADQVAKGEKKNTEVSKLFNKAAEALPGLSSGSTFNSLINAEKHINDPYVQSLIKTKGSAIGSLVDRVSSIKF